MISKTLSFRKCSNLFFSIRPFYIFSNSYYFALTFSFINTYNKINFIIFIICIYNCIESGRLYPTVIIAIFILTSTLYKFFLLKIKRIYKKAKQYPVEYKNHLVLELQICKNIKIYNAIKNKFPLSALLYNCLQI